jgi:hypothetical protein
MVGAGPQLDPCERHVFSAATTELHLSVRGKLHAQHHDAMPGLSAALVLQQHALLQALDGSQDEQYLSEL